MQRGRRGRGERSEEGSRGPQGGSGIAPVEARREPEDAEGRGRRAGGGVRAAADADAGQRAAEERARRRKRGGGGVSVFREPAAGVGAGERRARLEGRKGARCRLRTKIVILPTSCFMKRKRLFLSRSISIVSTSTKNNINKD